MGTYLAHVDIERGLSRNTVAAYRRDLERYVQWCGGRGLVEVDSVTENDVADYVAGLSAAGLSAASAARMSVSVRTFHRFLLGEGMSASDPAAHVRPPSIPLRLPKALAYEQVAQLIAHAGDVETPEGLRNRALVEVLYGTGARISEVVGLDVDDVDLESRTLLVTGKGQKQRLLPLGDFAADAVDEMWAFIAPKMLGGPSGTGLDHPTALADLAGELGIADLVRFEPPSDRERLAQWYRAADATVVPSYSESFGLVAVESQACGTPVVAASVGGLRTAVADGRSGLLVPGHEVPTWSAHLSRMLTRERDHLASGARAHAEGFSWDATADALIASYSRAIGEHAALPLASGTP